MVQFQLVQAGTHSVGVDLSEAFEATDAPADKLPLTVRHDSAPDPDHWIQSGAAE